MKIVKIIGVLLLIVIVAVGSLILYVKTALPDVGPAPEMTVDRSEAHVARGKYLAHAVAACMDCHSKRLWQYYSGPLDTNSLGCGGEVFNQDFGFPGIFYSKNLTPAGLSKWTDGEIFRAVTSGVNKDGVALFPVMPHHNYGKCDPEDIKDIIAYLRTLPAIQNEIPKSVPDFPMSVIINTIPSKPQFTKRPSPEDKVKYGEYICRLASCNDCHSKQDKGKEIEGMHMAGGFEFKLPGIGTVRSANLTPDSETGLTMDEETFVHLFKDRANENRYIPVAQGQYNTVMPWMMYGQMEESDLRALYQYLKTLKPIKNKVEKFTKNS